MNFPTNVRSEILQKGYNKETKSISNKREGVPLSPTDRPMLPMVLMLVPSLARPADTLAQWIALLIVCATSWFMHFARTRKPDAILHEEDRRKKNVVEMMKAVVACVLPAAAHRTSHQIFPIAYCVIMRPRTAWAS